jgi:hypothetical protein
MGWAGDRLPDFQSGGGMGWAGDRLPDFQSGGGMGWAGDRFAAKPAAGATNNAIAIAARRIVFDIIKASRAGVCFLLLTYSTLETSG